jgi:hypothetical protein
VITGRVIVARCTAPAPRPRRRWFTVALAGALLLTSACAAPAPRTSRLTVSDFEFVSSEMSAKLAASSLLEGRTPGYAPMTVAVSKVENFSTDILSEGEKWYLVDSVLDSESMRALRDERNIRFVIPAEKLTLLRKTLGPEEQVAAQRSPTHTLTARIRSVTRAASLDRTDLYSCEFSMVLLDTGEIVWSDSVLLKRIARGRSYN